MTVQNSVAQCTVIADPKAIAARRNGGKIQQTINVREIKTAKQANDWRMQQGLEPMRKRRD